MKKKFATLVAGLLGLVVLNAQITAPNEKIQKLCDHHLMNVGGEYLPIIPDSLFDRSFNSLEFPNHGDKITSSIPIPNKYKPFNVKKDNIANIAIKSFKLENGANGYEFFVLHSDGYPCDMNEFNVRIEAENIECETYGNYNIFKILGNSIDYADGTYPMEGNISIKHRASGQSIDIPFSLSWFDLVSFPSGTTAFLVDDVQSNVFKHSFLVTNLKSRNLWMLKAPIVIDVSGKDGADGRDGANGKNGHGEFITPIFKVRIPATAGKPGENGEDGENGNNGGNVLICHNISEAHAITAKYGGGAAGKGGKGGAGGKHGPGCGLYGYASNGIDGRDGIPGKKGSCYFHYITQQNVIKNANRVIIPCFPSIWVDMTPRLATKNTKGQTSSVQAASSAVEF